MLKNPCKATGFHIIHMTANQIANAFYIKAGWPNKRPIRSRWKSFFITSALSKR
jgi:hypothetical protein